MSATTIDWGPATRHLRTVDKKLAPVIDRHSDPTISPTTDAVRSLARAIVSQQLSGKAADTIWGRFLALYRGTFPSRPRSWRRRTPRCAAPGYRAPRPLR